MKITEEITKQSPDVASLGVIIGAMSGDVKALEKVKKEAGSVDEFLERAGDIANVALIVSAVKTAMGYEYTEVQKEIKRFVDGYNTDGTVRLKEVPVGERKITKLIRPSETLLKFLLMNRLPQYFSDVKKIEVNKKVTEIKADTEEEIRKFAGKLLESITVDAKFEDEPTANEAEKAPGIA